MNKLKAVPHKISVNDAGQIIHLDVETLTLTELTEVHRSILEYFNTSKTIEDAIESFANQDGIEEYLEELSEFGLIAELSDSRFNKQVNLQPNVRAFRIVLTEQCNLRCAECFVTKNQDKLRTMRPEVLEDVIRRTIPFGFQDQITYHFFGGEPLIKFDYIQRAVELTQQAVAKGVMKKPRYTITTNLTILSDEILDFLEKYDFKVGVSVDGSEEINDKLRVYRNGSGTFQDVARNYDKLTERGIDAHVLLTPHPEHLDEIEEIFVSIIDRFPMKTITVNTPLHFQTVKWTVPGTLYASRLMRLIRIAKGRNISVDSAASPPLAALSGQLRREGPCTLICDTIMASVGPDGSMSFCSQKWHHLLTVSQVDSEAKVEIPIRRPDECGTCEAKHICGGPCPAFQKIMQQDFLLDTNKCDFMRALVGEVANNLDLFEIAK